MSRGKRIVLIASGILILLLAIGASVIHHYFGSFSVKAGSHREDPAKMACWPWPHAEKDSPHAGVTRWIDDSSADGTLLELFDFDFSQNPRLRLELYDQDEDDKTPFDNRAEFKNRAVGQITRHLNKNGRGQVVAAWNGLFFMYTDNVASHVAPVVLSGKALYNVGKIRWAVGVKYEKSGPHFKVLHLPDFRTLGSEYDFAAEGASCLINEGRALRLRPFPKLNEEPFPPSVPPTPDESGFVRRVDHIRTSRTSMAWSKDNKHFYLLIVKEPDAEAPSIVAFRNNMPLMGGWTVADEQRFWQQFGAWCAVNLDGGDVTQLTSLRKDGKYDLIPARWGDGRMRAVLPADCSKAPSGGSMMYFFIRDTAESDGKHRSQ